MTKNKIEKFERNDIVKTTCLIRATGETIKEGSKGYIIKDSAEDMFIVAFHPSHHCKSDHDIHVFNMERTGEKFSYYDKEMFYEWYPVTTKFQELVRNIELLAEDKTGKWKPYLGEVSRALMPLYSVDDYVKEEIGVALELLEDGKPIKAYNYLREMEKRFRTIDALYKMPADSINVGFGHNTSRDDIEIISIEKDKLDKVKGDIRKLVYGYMEHAGYPDFNKQACRRKLNKILREIK